MFLFGNNNKKTQDSNIGSEESYIKECSDEELKNNKDIENYFLYEFQRCHFQFKNAALATGALAMGLVYVTGTDNVLKNTICENQTRNVVVSTCKTFYTIAGLFAFLSAINGAGMCHAQKEIKKHQRIMELIDRELINRRQNGG